MPKRPRMTAADYAAMAICPSLIVLMLAALMHFVILCLYRGPYPARLTYILFMFIMGATGIARISIEFGRSYASLYAGALGLAVIFVLGPVAFFPVALIWFLADRITFDCTVIDDGKDASGEGLIESGGLFGGKRPQESVDVSLDGTTARAGEVGESGDAQADSGGSTVTSRRKRRKTHKPGKTVFYLALAALPLFGLGQFLLPPQESVRDQAAVAMGLYLFATLTLMVVTSFLGLRRYLRQRGAEMPADVSVAWVAGGTVLTAVMLIACFALPLPGHMLAVAEIPKIESPRWFSASRFGWGKEGVENGSETNKDAAKVTDPSSDQPPGSDTDAQGQGEAQSQESDGQSPSSSSQSDAGQQASGQSQSDESQSGQSQRRQSQSGDDASGGRQSSQNEADQTQANQSGSGQDPSQGGEAQANRNQQSGSEPDRSTRAERSAEQNTRAGGEPSSDEATSQREGQADPPDSGDQSGADRRREQPTDESSGSSAEPQRESGEATPEQTSSTSDYSPPSLPNFLSGIGTLVKFLVVLILIGIIVIYLLKNPHLWRQWLDALAALFRAPEPSGDAGDAEEPDPLAPVSHRPFRSFSNPLNESGDPRRAIVVTFQALDAWAREQGYPRHEDETPSEFATRLAHHHPSVSEDLPRLADAYNRIVYGRSKAMKRDIQAASSAWQLMSSAPRETPAV